MRKVLLAAVALAVTGPLATGALADGLGPKPPTSPYPSCNPVVTPTVTVTDRADDGTPTAGTIAFTTVATCDHDQLAMTIATKLTTRAGKKLAAATASCTFSPSSDCNALTIKASKKRTKHFAGDYLLVTTYATQGYDWQVAHAQSVAGLWADPCTHDATWTSNSCTDTTLVQVK